MEKVQFDKTLVTDWANAICAEYCKYPDEYESIYSDDADEAQERLSIEKCLYCPIVEMLECMEYQHG